MKKLVTLFLFALTCFIFGQTNPTAQSLPYSQNFGTSTFTTLPAGWAIWAFSGASATTRPSTETSAPTADAAALTAATAAQTTGKVYGYSVSSNARLYIQTSSNTTDGADQAVLAISTTSKSNIVVSYDVEVVSINTRTMGLILQYRVGTTGNWFTLCGNYSPFSQVNGSTGNIGTAKVTLPPAAENKSVVQLRWATWRGSEAGNSGGVAIDNISITAGNSGTTYYSKSSGSLDLTSSWGINTDGSGTNPANFTTSGDIFNIRNNSAPTIAANWGVVGRVYVGDGTSACNLTIPSSYYLNGLVTVNTNGTLTLQNSNLPTLESSATGSTVNYNQSSGTVALYDINYGGNLYLTSGGTKTWNVAAARTVGGDIQVSGTSYFLLGNSTATISGNLTVDDGATIGCSNNSGVFTAATAGTQTFTLNGTCRVTSNYSQTPTPTTGFTRQFAFDAYVIGANSIVSFRSPSTAGLIVNVDQPAGVSFANVEFLSVNSANITFEMRGNFQATGSISYTRIASSGTITVNYNSYTMKVGKDITLSLGTIGSNVANANAITGGRTYNMGTSTIELNGSTPQAGIGPTDLLTTFNNLTINNASGITLSGIITVNGTLKMVSGNLSLGGNTLTYGASSILRYSGSSQQTTADAEFPGSAGPATLTIDNASGVILHAARTVGSLSLLNGILTTSGANLLTLTNTSTNPATGGSSSNYVNGPLALTIPANQASGSTFSFPIGKSQYNALELINPVTTSGGSVVIQAEVFDQDAQGTAGTNLSNLATNRYWSTSFASGAANFTSTKIKLTENSLGPISGIGQSATLNGAYNSISGTFTGTAVVSGLTTNTMGYFAFGQKTDMQPLNTGTYAVGNSQTYTNITAVIADLNVKQITNGNVVFELASDYDYSTETYPLTFYPFADGGNNYSVTIRPQSGISKSIIWNSSSPVFDLVGVKNLIIDGRDGGSTTNTNLTIANGASGGSAFRLSGDAYSNTLTYLNVSAQVNTANLGIISFLTGNSTGNDNNTISYCNINGNNATYRAIYSVGTSSSVDNSNNTVRNNNIYDWFNNSTASTPNAAVYLGSGNSAWTINNNSIYYTTATRTISNTNTYYGVYISSSTGNNFTVSSNYIGGNGNLGGSAAFIIPSGADSRFWGIDIDAVGTTTASNIQGNTISKITVNSTPTAAGIMYGIYLGQGSVNIGTTADNIIGSTSANDAIVVNFTTSSSSPYIDGIRMSNTSASDVVNIGSQTNKNSIGGISVTGALTGTLNFTGIRYGVTGGLTNYNITNNVIGGNFSNSLQCASTVPCVMTGIMNNIGGTGSLICSNNTISNLTNNSTFTSSSVRGIYLNYNASSITGNTISNLSSAAANVGTGSNAVCLGILDYSSIPNQVISGNTVTGLSATISAATNSYLYGITYTGPASGTNEISKNQVSALTISNTNTSSSVTIRGLMLNGGTGLTVANNMVNLGGGITVTPTIAGIELASSDGAELYFNTSRIQGTHTTGNANSSFAFRRTATSTTVLKNNIFSNERTFSGTGFTGFNVAFRTLNLTTLTSDYNDLYVADATYGKAGMFSATGYTTLSDWKTYTVGQSAACEAHSVSGLPPFTSTTDLSIDGTQSGCWVVKSKGFPIASIVDDYSATNVRSNTITSGPVDIGADEFTTSQAPVAAVLSSGSIANEATSVYTVYGKTICSIKWHQMSGTLPTSLDVRYHSGVRPSGIGAKHASNCIWHITAPDGANYLYDITLNYDPNILGDITAENVIRPAKSEDNSIWAQFSDTGAFAYHYTLDNSAKTTTIDSLASFSYFTLGDHTNPLPVELHAFNAEVKGRNIQLSWQTISEISTSKFVIERCFGKETGSWTQIGEAKAAGYSNVVKNYAYEDKNLGSGKVFYRLRMIDNDGSFSYSSIASGIIDLPKEYALSQNYPNPFNPTTRIDYQLPFSGKVNLEIYSVSGQKVADLINAYQEANYYSIPVNLTGMHLSTGIYIYRISATDLTGKQKFVQSKKMLLLK
ncbi:MAG: T9SS type A sorting domain-containing protein [Ignavibacteria bacterium]|nr:T9SS type A sorting domain-containing protein [Ignavibacteria bacterium]